MTIRASKPGYTGGEHAADADPAEMSLAARGRRRARPGSRAGAVAVGRDEAIERWLTGDGGPDNQMTKLAPGVCETCGFFVRLQGGLGVLFGACANAYSASDGVGGQRRPRLRSPLERRLPTTAPRSCRLRPGRPSSGTQPISLFD